jgi:hypothetical protein
MDQLTPFLTAFFKTTYSQADARRRIGLLEQAIEQTVYTQGSKKSIETVVNELAKQKEDAQAVLSFLSSIKLPSDTTLLKKLLAGLRDAVISRPVAILAVPFEPTPEQIVSYGEWFRTNVSPDVLLSITFDASVVGGCSITWGGKQVTYDLEYLIKQKRSEIVAVVDQFVEKKRHEKVI